MKAILICDDKRYREHIKRVISSQKNDIDETETLTDAKKLLHSQGYDVAICSLPILHHFDPDYIMKQLKEAANENCQIIFLSQCRDVATVIRLVRKGLFTWLTKPEELDSYLEQLPLSPVAVQPTPTRQHMQADSYIQGISAEANELYNQIDTVAPTDFNVIIYGETGTGKEAVARRLALSKSPDAPYITLDCGCLSKELAASELFGHTKGAFTGALESKTGAFEAANGGTLFLDEIGNLNFDVQASLLRAIEERKIRKVGDIKEIPVDVRILVASNYNLADSVKQGHFREDLYHRLNEFEIIIPPLRNRKEDIPVFVDSFLEETNLKLKKNIPGLQPEVWELLLEYTWPGNIRELKNVIRRACLLTADNRLVGIKSLPIGIAVRDSSVTFDPAQSQAPMEEALKITSYKAELQHIATVLQQVNYNKTKAAALLSIDRKTLYNKLKKFPVVSKMALKA